MDRVLARVTRIGADPRDDADLRARKALLVLISVLILPISALWGVLYLALGSPVGVVPLVYFGVLLAGIAVFSRTRDYAWLLRVSQVAILLAPTLSMIPLGGFLDSAGVGLWGILAPLGALVFNDVRSAARWFAAWVVVFLGSVWCVRQSRHIQVDLLYHYLPRGLARTLSTFVDLVRVGFFAYASWLLWRYVGIVAGERMVTIDLPRGIVFWSVFAAFVLMLIRAVQVAVANWRRGYSVLERPEMFDSFGELL